ncbi:hypothetical protein M9H77_36360 [Catharanthus roseus]|uniref:Uncharacterized protein n=1 Tax=Catharanthus roseus TaxID=4058 RepID=A0ACB9ZSF8_CATRO|nr:hypothetical protein M9H77_36360 [Catharanthus roseus]
MYIYMRILAPDPHTGLKFIENQVNGCVSGLHCTWLVPRTRASSDDVDGFLTLRVDPLEEGRSTLRISSERSGAQQATEILGQEFLDQISPEEHIAKRHADALLSRS